MNPAQPFAWQALDPLVSKLVVLAQLREYRTDLALSKAKPTQRREELGLDIEGLGVQRLPVFGAMGMPEAEPHVGVALDDELAAMGRSVICNRTLGNAVDRVGARPAQRGAGSFASPGCPRGRGRVGLALPGGSPV